MKTETSISPGVDTTAVLPLPVAQRDGHTRPEVSAPETAELPRRGFASPFGMGPLGLATFLFVGITALFLAFALVIALALPYGDWDAMSFGVWSRLIAEHWPHVRFAEASAADYQRPLFYFVQGTAWTLFGFHQALGKTLSLLFSGLLLASMAWLTARTVRVERRFAA